MTLTNLNNVVVEGVTIEFSDGSIYHADFMDDVLPDRTCGQWDRGIYVIAEDGGFECFVSYTDGSVWQGETKLDARCPEICVMAAVRDARETFYFEDCIAL